MIERCLKLIYKSQSIGSQVKDDIQDGTISWTHMAWLHSQMTDSQTKLQTNLHLLCILVSHTYAHCTSTYTLRLHIHN